MVRRANPAVAAVVDGNWLWPGGDGERPPSLSFHGWKRRGGRRSKCRGARQPLPTGSRFCPPM